MTAARTQPAAAPVRRGVKRCLALLAGRRRPRRGTTILIYHRVGGGTPDERDCPAGSFAAQVDLLRQHRVIALDDAIDELEAGDDTPKVVVTFDDGFADVHRHAWPLLRDADLPFTLYVATAHVGGAMRWEGSTASVPGPGLTWEQLGELAASDLVTVGNHTHTHARPEALDAGELDRCTAALEDRLGVTADHFAYTWGVPVPHARPLLAARFRSAATGRLGRNHPATDRYALRRVPVRATDPLPFFAAKLAGGLGPERAYARLVAAAKRVGVPA